MPKIRSAAREGRIVEGWMNPLALKGAVERLLRRGEIEKAAAALSRRLAAAPRDADALLLSAIVAVHQDDAGRAREILRGLVARDPGNALAHALRGFLIDLAAGDVAAALEALTRSATLRPEAGWPLALRSQVRLAMGDLQACLQDLDRAVALEPAGWIFRLRYRYLRDHASASAAFADLERAIAADPKDSSLHEEFGDILFRSKDYGRSVAEFSRAIKLRPEDPVRVLAKRAEAYWSTESPDRALDDFRRCLRLSPSNDYLRLRAGRVALYRGDARFVASCLAAWKSSGKPEARARAGFLRGLQALERKRYRAAAGLLASAEELSRGTYFASEFPGISYSRMAKALGFLAKGRKR